MSDRRPVDPAVVWSMVSTLQHRGPDAHGVWQGPGLCLGHTRLAVIDPDSTSDQPFSVDDETLTIVYNGEIFNYVELREQLQALGHVFVTRSDTEVVLRAYKEWSSESVTFFNGMWAFAIYDRSRDLVFCSRDRFGIKPFNYALAGGRFWFASETKALLAAMPELAVPDYRALSMILRSSRGARLKHTCFADIKRLAPAHNLTVTRSGVEFKRYWQYPRTADIPASLSEAAGEVHRLLGESVALRMRSDVPVGTALSGGVDSASIACLVGHLRPGDHHTFTASYPGQPGDESDSAARLSSDLGMTPHAVPTEPSEFLPTLRAIVRHLEAPGYSPAVLPLWNIVRAARPHATVLLDGQGADELFAGYTRDCIPHAFWETFRGGRPGEALRDLIHHSRVRDWKETALFTGRALAPGAHRAYRYLRGDETVLSGPLRHDLEHLDEDPNTLPVTVPLNAALRFQHRGTLVDLLHYGDAIGMAHSVEMRSPFLDHNLVEYAFGLPPDYKLKGGIGKVVLREAMSGVVPGRVLGDPQKLGFPVPLADWFRRWPDQTVAPVLLSDRCRDRRLFDEQALRRALRRHLDGRIDLSNQIFRWITTELWFQEFVD